MNCAIIQVIFNFPTTKQEIQIVRRYLIFFLIFLYFKLLLISFSSIHWMWKWLIYLEREGKLCLEKLLFLGYIRQLRNTRGPRVTQLWLRYYKLFIWLINHFHAPIYDLVSLLHSWGSFKLLQSCNLQIDLVLFFFPWQFEKSMLYWTRNFDPIQKFVQHKAAFVWGLKCVFFLIVRKCTIKRKKNIWSVMLEFKLLTKFLCQNKV